LPRRWRSRLLMLAVLYFTFLGGTFVTDLSFWPRVAHHVIVTAALVGWLISLWRRHSQIPATPLDAPLALVFVAYAVATLFAVDPRVSAESLWQIGVHILFYYIVVDIMRRWPPRAVLEPIFLSAAVVILVGVAEFVSWYFGLNWLPMFQQGWPQIGGLAHPFPPLLYRLSFTLGVSTSLSGYLALLIPVALAWALSTPTRDVRRGLLAWIAGAIVVLILSFSRGGLLSLGVSLSLLAVLIIAGNTEIRGWIFNRLRGWRLPALLGAALLAVVAVLFVWLRSAGLSGHAAGDDVRRNLFDSAWQIGLAHPVIGVGPYGFGRALRLYRDQAITGDHFTAAHNAPLQIWAEAGAIGLIAFAALVAAVLWVAARRWRGAQGAERLRVAGVVAALIGFSAQNMVDTFTNTPLLLPVMACAAYLALPLHKPDQAPSPIRQALQNLIALMVAVSVAGWAFSDVAQYHFNQSGRFADSGDLDSALDEIQQARRIDPAMGFYDFQRAQYLAKLSASQPALLPQAITAYQDALLHEQTYALNHANLAILLANAGRSADAAAQMQEAVSWQFSDAHYVLGYAVLSEQNHDDAVARDAYINALELKPEWVESAFWASTPLRSQARDDFSAAHGLTAFTPEQLGALSPLCWPVEQPLPRFDQAPVTQAQTAACLAERSLRIDNDPGETIALAADAIALDPANPTIYMLRAAAYLATGEDALAETDARTALFLQDNHAYAILGQLAEDRGDFAAAEEFYKRGGPIVVQLQGWDVSVYARRGDLALLPQLDAPGPGHYEFAAWDALARLYDKQGRASDAGRVRDIIRELDPYHPF